MSKLRKCSFGSKNLKKSKKKNCNCLKNFGTCKIHKKISRKISRKRNFGLFDQFRNTWTRPMDEAFDTITKKIKIILKEDNLPGVHKLNSIYRLLRKELSQSEQLGLVNYDENMKISESPQLENILIEMNKIIGHIISIDEMRKLAGVKSSTNVPNVPNNIYTEAQNAAKIAREALFKLQLNDYQAQMEINNAKNKINTNEMYENELRHQDNDKEKEKELENQLKDLNSILIQKLAQFGTRKKSCKRRKKFGQQALPAWQYTKNVYDAVSTGRCYPEY